MSEKNPKISIIVPCYNAQRFLHKCLNTILNQTIKDIEIICVDDCSTDDTAQILLEFAKKDKRIKILTHAKNSGISVTRNTGIEAATGDYIAFIDSDDYIDVTMMEKLYNKAEKTGAEIVLSNIYLYFEDTGAKQLFRDNRYFTYLSSRLFTLTEEPRLVTYIGVWDRIYTRDLILKNNLRFPVGLVYEDHLFTIQAMACAKSITVVNEPLYYYRKNAGGSITDNEIKNDKYKFNFVEISKLIKTFMKNRGIYKTLQNEYLKYHIFYATIHQSNCSIKNFSTFFNMMRAITSDEDYEVLEKTNLNYLQEKYVHALKNNDVNSICPLMKSYSFARKVKHVLKKNEKGEKNNGKK